MAESRIRPTMKSKSGRNIKVTDKMAQLMLENEILRTELEISKAEEQIRQVSLSQQKVDSPSVLNQTPNRKTEGRAENNNVSRDERKSPAIKDNTEFNQLLQLMKDNNAPKYASTPDQEPRYDHQIGYHPDRTPRFYNEQSSQDNNQMLEKLVTLLSDKQKLPQMEPDIFSGDILYFPTWMRSFETLIESNTSSSSERLHYLGKYTAGEAKSCIKGYFTLSGPDIYDRAKDILIARFGDKFKIGEAFKRELNNWPLVKGGDGIALQRLADFLHHCEAAMSTISYLQCLNNVEENRKILSKLPRYLIDRWNRIVDTHLYSSYQGQFPPFHVFVDFISKEARVACGPGNVKSSNPKEEKMNNKPGKNSANTFASRTSADSQNEPSNTTQRKAFCHNCKGEHELYKCDAFLTMDFEERKKIISAKGLCYGCLRRGHLRKDCKRKGPQLAYIGLPPRIEKPIPAPEQKLQLSSCKTDTHSEINSSGCYHSLIVPVVVHHKDNPNVQMRTYAALDNQSNACFISDDVVTRLDLKTKPLDLELTTMLGSESLTTEVAHGLIVRGIKEEKEVALPAVYKRDTIPVNKDLIPRLEILKTWPHLVKVAEKLEPVDSALDIGLLIGFNCSSALLPLEIVAAEENKPYGIHTKLGWGVIGSVSNEQGKETPPVFAFKTQVKEIPPSDVRDMFDRDFHEYQEGKRPYSFEDVQFMKIATKGITHRTDHHYELPLPLKGMHGTLPNNRSAILKRFNALKSKLKKDVKYQDDYNEFMKKLIENQHAELIPIWDINKSPAWYIPHHGVYHPKKPNKLRVVFDCSAEYLGHSLNKHLLQGPDLTNNLIGILCRFRQDKIAFTCDVEGMFHQVKVNPQHRDFLRFLWSEDLSKPPDEYRMTVHLFGATSSPACANFALQTMADEYEAEYGPSVSKFVRRNFYVDDGLKSVDTEEDAVNLIINSIEMFKKGGFRLHKFMCTNRHVLEKIPVSYRATELQRLDVCLGQMPSSRALGIEWSVEDDEFHFNATSSRKDVTRRSILSTVSSIFDPLGFVSPYILIGRKILQDICRDGLKWDDPVPPQHVEPWNKWNEELPLLKNIKIKRCYKTENSERAKTVELHHFSDASQTSYGQCSYLKITYENGETSTSLVMAKSRVAPSKPVTLPRLELMAATLSVKIARFLDDELEYQNMKHIFWTDSKIVLGYVSNDSRRFHVFVANRIQQIRDFTAPEQWRYINTKLNPADIASRGTSAESLINNSLWWNGPELLRSTEIQPEVNYENHLLPDDPEIKNSVVLSTQVNDSYSTLEKRLERFPSWNQACRAIALCKKYVKILKNKVLKNNEKTSMIVEVSDVQEAERVIIKNAQRVFDEEIQIIKRNASLPRKSSIHRLDPILSDDGLLRVGGRIKRSSLNFSAIHPYILPKDNHITKLIVKHYHQKTGHSGSNYTLSVIRSSGYWIINGRSQVASFIHKCVICRKLRGKTMTQKMADLPSDRLDPCPPFTYSAVDIFGPFIIKEGRSEKKRWGALFTCMVSRAIHIEVVHSLSTDSFINAYRRFISRRGPIRQLRSDRGTNFVGAKNELDTERIRQKLSIDNCDYFEFSQNVPHSSHMGGVWERMIRSARLALSSLLIDHPGRLNDESLQTLFTEAEAIVNSRPLTYLNTDDINEEPLSPMQILTLKSKTVLPPPGSFVKEDLYCRKRWRLVQYLATQFWQRWVKEFLPTLQERRKWQNQSDNLQVGDVVLVMDESLGRCQWPKGIITAIYPSKDGLVRKVSVKVKGTVYERPIHKLVLLLKNGDK